MQVVLSLDPVNILEAKVKDGQDIIEIEATPKSNDVVDYRSLFATRY